VEFVDPYDASEAQYHMNRQVFFGREITVVLAAESRKRPDEMRSRARVRGYSGHEGRRSSYYGRSRSRSRSPRFRGRPRSRSYSPAPRRRDDYSLSPFLQGERRHITSLLLGAHQRSLMKIRGDPILLPVEMMLIMVMRRGRPHQTATDHLRT